MYRREYIGVVSAIGIGLFAGCSVDAGEEPTDRVFDFYSWGEVDPITPPDMECMDAGQYS